MPTWIVFTAVASIVVTGALTWVLWRLNQGSQDETPRGERASDLAIAASDAPAHGPKDAADHQDRNSSDNTSDGGGGGGD